MKAAFLFALAVAVMSLGATPLHAEDWKTTDGKTYQDVQVVKAEPDAVTIVHSEGSARVPMENLPPELQKRFSYDPDKARDARAAKAQAEAQQAEAEQMAQAAIDAQNASAPPLTTEATATASSSSARTHYSMNDLIEAVHDLMSEDSETGHSSKANLLNSAHSLRPSSDSTHHSMSEIGGSL